ncbi:MAG TPA: prolyl oligopeptidase family serine peptidase [Candidatus Thermoplasmatota archaeon]|nr:prolyl oligopeptidase family serine peptidase [Candidatus Thermoplasmatota archaeon]
MRREAAAAALTLLLIPFAVPALAGSTIVPYTVHVNGRPADGLLALPDPGGPQPTVLVVMAHGYGHHVDPSWLNHLREVADRGYVAVAMDYGQTFQVREGAEESVAAAVDLQDEYGIDRAVMFSVSMGGAIAGYALAETPGVFDDWIDVEGVSMLAETWAEAKAVEHPAAGEIEEETGGTPTDVPMEYVRRSAALRAGGIRVGGLQHAIVVHAINDGLVPYDQGREMATALRGVGIPTTFHTVLRGSCAEQGTTGTDALLGSAPIEDNNPACLAGHASEASSTHPVMRTGLDSLFGLLDGSDVPITYAEKVVDAPDP